MVNDHWAVEADSTRLNLEPESHFFTKNEIPSANYSKKCNFGMLKKSMRVLCIATYTFW